MESGYAVKTEEPLYEKPPRLATVASSDMESVPKNRLNRYQKTLMVYLCISFLALMTMMITLSFYYVTDCDEEDHIAPHIIATSFLVLLPVIEVILFRPQTVESDQKLTFYALWFKNMFFEILDLFDLYTDVFFVATVLIGHPEIGVPSLVVLIITFTPRVYATHLLFQILRSKVPWNKSNGFKIAMCLEKLSFAHLMNIVDSNLREKMSIILTVWKLTTENIPQLILELIFIQLNPECENLIVYIAFTTSLVGGIISTALSLYYFINGIRERRAIRKQIERLFANEYVPLDKSVNIARSGEIVRQVSLKSFNKAILLEGRDFGPEHLNYLFEKLNPETPIWIKSGDPDNVKEAISESTNVKYLKLMKTDSATQLVTRKTQEGVEDTDRSLVAATEKSFDFGAFVVCFCQAIGANHSVISVDLSDLEIADPLLETIGDSLATSQTLRKLDLSRNKFRAKSLTKFITAINSQSNLEELNLTEVNLLRSTEFFNALVDNRTIKKLNVSTCNMSRPDVNAVCQMLEANFIIEDINLRCNDFDEKSIESLGAVFKSNGTLKRLNLELNNIDNRGLNNLFDNLEENHEHVQLEYLNLGRMRIGDSVARALQVPINLTSVNLSGSSLTKSGVEILATSLKSHSSIRYINLTSNNLKEEGVTILSKGIALSQSLDSLNLSRNDLTDRAIDILVESIISGRKQHFKKLHLAINFIGEVGVKKLGFLLKVCPKMEYIDLEDNNVTDLSLAYLEEGIKVSAKRATYINVIDNNLLTDKGRGCGVRMRKQFKVVILFDDVDERVDVECE